jgi:hypothetical protein
MKQKAVSALLIAALFMLVYSCSSVKVVSTYDEEVGAELRSRSFERVDEGADLVISLFLVMNVETVESDYTDHYKGYYGIGNFGAASSTPFEEYDYPGVGCCSR